MDIDDDVYVLFVASKNELDQLDVEDEVEIKDEILDESEIKVEKLDEVEIKDEILYDMMIKDDSEDNDYHESSHADVIDNTNINNTSELKNVNTSTPGKDNKLKKQRTKRKRNITNSKLAYKDIDPEKHMTIVEKIKEDTPEAASDENVLVDKLFEYMINEKMPDPPSGFFKKKLQKYQCTECKKLMPNLSGMKLHYQCRHGPRYLECYTCAVTFRNKTNLLKHEMRCKCEDIMAVLKARARAVARNGWQRPFLKTQSFLPFKILDGTYVGTNGQKMKITTDKSDQRSILKRPKFGLVCRYCPETLKSSNQLEQHENMHLGIKPYQCDKCPEAFSLKKSFVIHYQKHRTTTLICDVCGKVFTRKTTLVTHLKMHFPEKNYHCEFCDYTATHSSDFARHLAMYHEEAVLNSFMKNCERDQTLKCKICSYTSDNRIQLMAHEYSHKGTGLFECDQCLASYSCKSSLRHHKLKHERNLMCDICGHITMSKDALKKHLVAHKRKMYICDECNKIYAHKFPLVMHIHKVHKKLPPPCACEMCPKRYSRMYLLKEHMMKTHGILLVTKSMLAKPKSKKGKNSSKQADI